MSEDNLFKRILRGSTRSEQTKPEVSKDPENAPAVPEKILKAPVSRRTVLGGAASTAASMTGAPTMPQAPVIIQQGVPEAVGILSSKVTALRKFMHGLRQPIAADAFEQDAKVIRQGDYIYVPFLEPARRIREMVGDLPSRMTLGQLKEPKIIDKALELSGLDEYISDTTFDITEGAKRSLGKLQKITGLPDTATIRELQEELKKRTLQMIKMVAHSPNLPLPDSPDRLRIFEALKEELKRVDPRRSDSELAEYIDKVNNEERAFENARTQAQIGRRNSLKQADVRTLEEKRQKQNIELSERENIQCSVMTSVRESRDPADARVFLVTPLFIGPNQQMNLTRMHVQHLRQLLTQDEILDDYNPATTQIEEMGNSIRVTTTDKKFQEYLMSFVGGHEVLGIPNRLQIIIPPENKEK